MNVRSLCCVTLIAMLLPILVSCVGSERDNVAEAAWHVCIVSPSDHPSLAEAVEGFQIGFRESIGSDHPYQFDYYNAGGDQSLVDIRLQKAVAAKCNLIFTLTSTASAKARRYAAERGVPVVFTAVTDPVGAGVIDKLDGTRQLPITGVTDRYPTDRQASFMLEMLPHLKTVAILLNPAEQNSRKLAAEMEQNLSRSNLKVLRFTTSDHENVLAVARKAVVASDALIVDGDNTFTNSLESVVRAATEGKKPLYVGDPDSVRRGALAGVGPSYGALGRKAGVMAAKILSGTFAGKIPVEEPTAFAYIVNFRAAENFGVQVPVRVLSDHGVVWSSQE